MDTLSKTLYAYNHYYFLMVLLTVNNDNALKQFITLYECVYNGIQTLSKNVITSIPSITEDVYLDVLGRNSPMSN